MKRIQMKPFALKEAKFGVSRSVAILVSEILDLVSPNDFGMT